MDRHRNVFTGKKDAGFSVANCAICTARMRVTEAFKDDTGLVWCEEHKKRGLLLNYGKAHNWPEIRFRGKDGTRYAIGAGNDEELWKIPAIIGQEVLIDAAIAYLETLR